MRSGGSGGGEEVEQEWAGVDRDERRGKTHKVS